MAVGLTIPWGFESITLVRHGESKANTRELVPMQYGDHAIPLTDEGKRQAEEVGKRLSDYVRDGYYKCLVYCSPYRRTRETLEHLLKGADAEQGGCAIFGSQGPDRRVVYEDPRLREIDHGYGTVDDYLRQHEKRKIHGWFYYRFEGGEAPCDCYDRVSGFIASMWRQAERRNARRVLIVTHGITIRCFVMRFLHLSHEQFDSMENPENASVITLTHSNKKEDHEGSTFHRGRWSVRGLEIRKEGES